MAKAAIYAEQAKELFVLKGLALDTIVGILNGKVSRKTLYNWKIDGQWEDKRKEYLENSQSLYEGILEIAHICKDRCKLDPTPKNLLSLSRAISILNDKDALEVLEGKPAVKSSGDNKADTVKQIREILGIDEPQ